jgi:hypothetical protein
MVSKVEQQDQFFAMLIYAKRKLMPRMTNVEGPDFCRAFFFTLVYFETLFSHHQW